MSKVSNNSLNNNMQGIDEFPLFISVLELVNDVVHNDSHLYENIDYRALYDLCVKQHISSFIYSKIDNKCPKDIYDLFKQDYDMAFRRRILFKRESKTIYEELIKHEIVFMPFKGEDINKLYPNGSQRWFSDNDIYVRDREEIKPIMASLGYKSKSTYSDDSYHKEIFNFEFHDRLFNQHFKFAEYFKDAFRLCTKDNDYIYKMNDTDFYFYSICHLYKHFNHYGIGIRFYIDLYYLRKGLKIDENRLNELLVKYDLKRFYEDRNRVIENIFNRNYEDIDEIRLIFEGATFGDYDKAIERKAKEKGIVRYTLRRVFPSLSRMKTAYPYLIKLPGLYPIAWTSRLFGYLVNPAKIKHMHNELKIAKRKK